MDKSIFWNINEPLSYNKLFNFIIGQRGNGKTYGAKVWAIKRFLKFDETFIYLRRYDSERKSVCKTLCNDIQKEFKDHEFGVDRTGKFVVVDGEEAGYIMSLSTMSDLKSMSLPGVYNIIYDEFLIEKGVHHYLRDEPKVFLNFYETIARMRDVRVFFLANSTSVVNPYFSYFQLSLPFNDKSIVTKGELLLQLVMNPAYAKAKQQTRFGQIIQGTDYEEYSVMNKFIYDVNSFVERPTGKLRYECTFLYMDNSYGLWSAVDGMRMWLTHKTIDNHMTFALTNENHQPNSFMANPRNCIFFDHMIRYYRLGLLYFDSLSTKADFIRLAAI